MSFSERKKMIAAAIVHIFETSEPIGKYSAYAVLDDGAGVSYGINQFTHRSGSLYDVVTAYLANGGVAGREVLQHLLPVLQQKTTRAINALAANAKFKSALKAAAATPEMRAAQVDIGFGRYMRPAIEACEGSGFVMPLTLAVIYDSHVHGSYAKIRDKVSVKRSQFLSAAAFEKAWVTEYVQRRDHWLESVPRLKKTDYRTDFFLAQIGRNNWNLDLPMNVHGFYLTSKALEEVEEAPQATDLTAEAGESPSVQSASDLPVEKTEIGNPQQDPTPNALPVDSQPSNDLKPTEFTFGGYADKAEAAVNDAAGKFDRINGVAGAVTQRKDAAKSLWTMITGTVWQTVWAVIAFFLGLPREVWIGAAVLVGALFLLYLYRQIALGKIREKAKHALEGLAEAL